jgi:hypothetical protein
MKKSILLALAILVSATAFCGNKVSTPASTGKEKINILRKTVIEKVSKDLCVVTVNRPKSGMVEGGSPGVYVQISVVGSCTKSAENCEAAFISASNCAAADRDSKYEAAAAAAKKSTLENDV